MTPPTQGVPPDAVASVDPHMPFTAQSGRRRRQLLSAATAVPLLAAGLAVQQGPAAATEPPRRSTIRPVPDTHTVTLVTGDVVTVTTLADGQQIADVDRPDDAVGGVRMQEIGRRPVRPARRGRRRCSARTSSTGGCSTSPT